MPLTWSQHMEVARILLEPACVASFWNTLNPQTQRSLRLACRQFESSSRLLISCASVENEQQLRKAATWRNVRELKIQAGDFVYSPLPCPGGSFGHLASLTWEGRMTNGPDIFVVLKSLLQPRHGPLLHLSVHSTAISACQGLFSQCRGLRSLELTDVSLDCDFKAAVSDMGAGNPCPSS